jgi:hypothetical protein
MSEPGYDYSKLPKVNHDDYELPEGRNGWNFQETGRLAILVYLLVVILEIVVAGNASSTLLNGTSVALVTGGIIGSLIPAVIGFIGLFRRAGRWWSLVAFIATFVLNPFVLSIVFILFGFVVAF